MLGHGKQGLSGEGWKWMHGTGCSQWYQNVGEDGCVGDPWQKQYSVKLTTAVKQGLTATHKHFFLTRSFLLNVAGRCHKAWVLSCLALYLLAMSGWNLKNGSTCVSCELFSFSCHVLMVLLGDNTSRCLMRSCSVGFFMGVLYPTLTISRAWMDVVVLEFSLYRWSPVPPSQGERCSSAIGSSLAVLYLSLTSSWLISSQHSINSVL